MGNKYSNWFKVDLHIHTDASNLTKVNDYDGTFNLETLTLKLKENNVKLFSLTDHNIINVSAYEDYYKNFQVTDPVLLVGCEFDIKVKQDDDTYLTYHTLLIFNENTIEKVTEISKIIEDFFSIKNIEHKDRSLTVNDVFELFNDYHFFYIPHAGGHKNIIDAHKRADIKKVQEMVLLMECAHEKVKEKHRIKHLEGFDKLKDPDFRNKKDEAFINFSDNHNCEIYPTPKSGAEHEFYCLKGEPTFETLRFAFIDPESRIRTQKEVDNLLNVKKHISSIDIKNINSVVDCRIDFSPNLNVIIGGASSGKSLLFNLIGRKIENNKNAFGKYKKNDESVFIKPSNSSTFQHNLPFNANEIIYINQGDIVKYFENGDLKNLVLESGEEIAFQDAKTFLLARKGILIETFEGFKNHFDRFNTSYQKDFILQEGDFENMLSDKFHFSEFTPTHDIVDYNSKLNVLEDLLSNTNTFKDDSVFEITATENQTINQFIDIIQLKSGLIKSKTKTQEAKTQFIEDVNEILNRKNSTLESASRAKQEAFRRKSTLINSCSTLFQNAIDFNHISKSLDNYELEEKQEIKVNENVTLIMEIISEVPLKNGIKNCINNHNLSNSIYDNFLILLRDNKNLKDYGEYTDQRLMQKMKKETEDNLNNFDNPNTYLDYGINGNSKNKSPGYNAEMYLKTILQQDNCKLVMIDQPEDNLGNTFKNEDLINLLRHYKFSKQLILVTHNPSIVVYGDAECIILAKNNSSKISYEQLVLEKKESQKMIIDNLDGGKAIFDMRSRKYNIKKLLNS